MDWTRAIDGYCERTDHTLWSEPINAVTNIAFIIVAVIMWRRSSRDPGARWLSAVLFAIGVGSGLFHTFATAWSATADVIPIAVFTLSYIYLANMHFWKMPFWIAALGTVAFVPYAAALTPVISALPFFSISSAYWVLPPLIASYGLLLSSQAPETGRGLLIAAGLLVVSIIFRSLDEMVCHSLSFGTHFAWHVLNAILLGWMIEVLRRHKMKAA